jgi:superoxide dismutase, Cu-Zn family
MKHAPRWPAARVGRLSSAPVRPWLAMRSGALALVIGPCAVACFGGCNGAERGDKVNGASASSPAPAEGTSGEPATTEPTVMVPMQAEADLIAAHGGKVEGHAKFFQQPEGVLVVLELADASPGKKGVHVHAHGDCSNMQRDSMGPHFAPKLEQHALPSEPAPRHLGDLGNITVAGDGKGRLEIQVPAATLGADESTSFLGRALIVDSGEDTGSGAQPGGNAGAPVACGVIHERGS